jgi:hypothetical protein
VVKVPSVHTMSCERSLIATKMVAGPTWGAAAVPVGA